MTISLVDFSQLVISSVAVNQDEFARESDPANLIKHVALTQLLALKKRFKSEMILCCDSRSYWRKSEYPAYKAHRKHAKKDSKLDWNMVYETLDELKKDLSLNFPYLVLEVDGAEADDLIAILVKYFQTHNLIQTGLLESPEDIVICSTDKDFMQLQKYKNVSQWNNVQKKLMHCENPNNFLIEHICTGDTGDNIGNVCTGDDWAIARSNNVSARASSFMTKRLPEFFEKGIDACVNESERRNYKRNELLVDFDKIPDVIYNKVIDAYTSSAINGNTMSVFKYLNEKRMKLLTSDFQSF